MCSCDGVAAARLLRMRACPPWSRPARLRRGGGREALTKTLVSLSSCRPLLRRGGGREALTTPPVIEGQQIRPGLRRGGGREALTTHRLDDVGIRVLSCDGVVAARLLRLRQIGVRGRLNPVATGWWPRGSYDWRSVGRVSFPPRLRRGGGREALMRTVSRLAGCPCAHSCRRVTAARRKPSS